MATEVRRIQFDFTSRDHGVGRDLDRIADSADGTNERLQGMGSGGAGAAGKLTKGLGMVGAALAAAGVGVATFSAALQKGLDAEAATAKLSAQLGLTKDESARIGKDAGAVYAQAYGESMDEVKGAIKSVIANMDGMRDASSADLQATTMRAMDLATVMEEDVGRVTVAVSQMMRTGLAKDSKEAFDIVTRGAQLGANKSQDLLDTLEEYSVQFTSMGLSGQTAMGIIVQGLKAGGRNADLVADTIKEFSIEAVAGAKRVMGGFKSLGLNGEQMSQAFAAGGQKSAKALDLVFDRLRSIEDPVKRNQVAIQLFGTKAEDMGRALFAIDPSKAVGGLGDLAGAADKAGKTMGTTAKARFTAFKRSLEVNVTNFIGDKVLPAFGRLGDALSKSSKSPENVKLANQLRESWGRLSSFLKTTAVPALRGIWDWFSNKILPVIQKFHREVLKELLKQFDKVMKQIDKNKPTLKELFKNLGAVAELIYKTVGPIMGWLAKNVLKLLGTYVGMQIKQFVAFAKGLNSFARVASQVGDGAKKVWKGVRDGAVKLKDVSIGAFRTMAKVFLDAVGKLVNGAAKAFGWVPGVGKKLKDAAKKVEDFKNQTNTSLGKISKGKTVPIKIKATTTGGAVFEIGKGFLPRAKGGPIPHTGPGASEQYDSVPALLRVNEHVWTPEEVKGMGGHDKVFKLRAMAKAGLLKGFAKGGPVSGFGVAVDAPSAGTMQRTVWSPINAGIAGIVRQMAKELTRLYQMFGGANGVVAAARKMIGYPYSWGGGGKGGPSYGIGRGAGTFGFDCSGLTEYAWWQGAKLGIGGVTYSQHPASRPLGGPRPGALGFSTGLGHVVLASDRPGFVIEAPFTGSHVREVRKSMPDWRWPKGARFAAGGPVRKLGADFVSGSAGRRELGMARLAGIAGDVGFRALGGPVSSGMPYVVGENGPEIYVPRQAGQVYPAGSTVVVQNITAIVQVPPSADKGAVGRELNECLREYKQRGGKLVTP